MEITVRTYGELRHWVEPFFEAGGQELVICVSDPGKGKSELVRRLAEQHDAWYCNAAQLTDFQFYLQSFGHRNKNAVLDDVEAILRHKASNTLRDLVGTDWGAKGKRVGWYGRANMTVERDGKTVRVPQEYYTRSRVMIACNKWSILADKLEAIVSRAVIVFFRPDNAECHEYARQWFLLRGKDYKQRKTVFDYIGAHLDTISSLDLRWYGKCLRMEKQGQDWRESLQQTWSGLASPASGRSPLDIVEEIQEICQLEPLTSKEQEQLFRDLCAAANMPSGSPAAYYRWLAKWRQRQGTK